MSYLDQLDAEISRCIDCGDWRWRATYLRCQQCGASSLADRLCPPDHLSSDEIDRRWRDVSRVWAGLGRFHSAPRPRAVA